MEPSGAGDRTSAVPVWRRPWVVACAALVVTGGWVALLPRVPAPRARVAWLGADEAAPRPSALQDRCDPTPLSFKRRVAVGSGPELECPEFTGVIRVPDDLAKGILLELRQDQDDRWWVRNRSADSPAEALFDADGKPLEFVTRVSLVPERWDLLLSGTPRLALLGRFATGFEAPPAEEEVTGAVGLTFSTTAPIDDPALLDPSKRTAASPALAYQALVANVADHAWYKWGARKSHGVVRIRAEADGATRQLPDVTLPSSPEGLRFGSEFRLEQDAKGALTIVDLGAPTPGWLVTENAENGERVEAGSVAVKEFPLFVRVAPSVGFRLDLGGHPGVFRADYGYEGVFAEEPGFLSHLKTALLSFPAFIEQEQAIPLAGARAIGAGIRLEGADGSALLVSPATITSGNDEFTVELSAGAEGQAAEVGRTQLRQRERAVVKTFQGDYGRLASDDMRAGGNAPLGASGSLGAGDVGNVVSWNGQRLAVVRGARPSLPADLAVFLGVLATAAVGATSVGGRLRPSALAYFGVAALSFAGCLFLARLGVDPALLGATSSLSRQALGAVVGFIAATTVQRWMEGSPGGGIAWLRHFAVWTGVCVALAISLPVLGFVAGVGVSAVLYLLAPALLRAARQAWERAAAAWEGAAALRERLEKFAAWGRSNWRMFVYAVLLLPCLVLTGQWLAAGPIAHDLANQGTIPPRLSALLLGGLAIGGLEIVVRWVAPWLRKSPRWPAPVLRAAQSASNGWLWAGGALFALPLLPLLGGLGHTSINLGLTLKPSELGMPLFCIGLAKSIAEAHQRWRVAPDSAVGAFETPPLRAVVAGGAVLLVGPVLGAVLEVFHPLQFSTVESVERPTSLWLGALIPALLGLAAGLSLWHRRAYAWALAGPATWLGGALVIFALFYLLQGDFGPLMVLAVTGVAALCLAAGLWAHRPDRWAHRGSAEPDTALAEAAAALLTVTLCGAAMLVVATGPAFDALRTYAAMERPAERLECFQQVWRYEHCEQILSSVALFDGRFGLTPSWVPVMHQDLALPAFRAVFGLGSTIWLCLGLVAVPAALILLAAREFDAASESARPFARFRAFASLADEREHLWRAYAFGLLAALFSGQCLIGIGGATYTLLLTGVTLPFVSNGGGSLASWVVTAGIVLALRRTSPTATAGAEAV